MADNELTRRLRKAIADHKSGRAPIRVSRVHPNATERGVLRQQQNARRAELVREQTARRKALREKKRAQTLAAAAKSKRRREKARGLEANKEVTRSFQREVGQIRDRHAEREEKLRARTKRERDALRARDQAERDRLRRQQQRRSGRR